MDADEFINIRLAISNLDTYNVRKTVFEAILNEILHFNGELLDAGCGKMPYRKFILDNSKVSSYTGLDIEGAIVYDKEVRPDVLWDGKVMPFEDEVFDCVIATEVLEHCPDPDQFLNEVFRVLKSGGVFFFTVPFLWPLHEVPHDQYRYTPWALEKHFKNAEYKDIIIKAMGGWHASMAQMLGLWVRRAPLPYPRLSRKLISFLLFPFYSLLLKAEKRTDIEFRESTMITGLYGTARK